MLDVIEELKRDAKHHKYFWNGLFAALYEDVRERVTVAGLTTDSGSGYQIAATKSVISSYLACEREMDFDYFMEFCKGIKVDIEKKRYMEIAPYVNRAFAYLEEQMDIKKCSKSKKCRKAVFEEANLNMDENHKEAEKIALDNLKKEKILKAFSDLSKEELNLLYRVADGYEYILSGDVFFMEHYSCLNEKGQKLFQEALAEKQKQKAAYGGDEMCSFCKEMEEEKELCLRDITADVLLLFMLGKSV